MFEAARSQCVGATRTRQQQVGAAAADAALQRAHLQAAKKREGAGDRADPPRAEFLRDTLVHANRGNGPISRSFARRKWAVEERSAFLIAAASSDDRQRRRESYYSGMPEYFSYAVFVC